MDESRGPTLREGRAAYFESNHFGPDGGYGLKWAPVKVGPLPMRIPNSAARVRALRIHDLNHVVSGYATTWLGETEIGAWEVASGCGTYAVAWFLNLAVMTLGFPSAPRRTLRAFARGRRSRNLYRAGFSESLLHRSVDEVRAELGLDAIDGKVGPADVLVFGLWYAAGLLIYAAPVLALLGLWRA